MRKNDSTRYELILGFVTVLISLSAFKEELSKIVVNLKFISFSLSQFFFVFIIGCTVAFYLYSIERLFDSVSIRQALIVKWIRIFSYWLFAIFIISPLLIAIIWGITRLNFDIFSKIFFEFIITISSGLSAVLGAIVAERILKQIKRKRIEDLSEKQIEELEIAVKLFEKEFYSQCIVELNKVLITHLVKLLQNKNIDASQIKFSDIVKYCIKKELIRQNESIQIDHIRKLRNKIVHSNLNTTREDASASLNFVRNLLKQTTINKKD